MKLLLSIAVWLGWIAGATLGADADLQPPAKYERPVLIEFTGTITGSLEQFVRSKLEAAHRQKADLVIVQIDSPGGQVGPSLNLAEAFREIGWARTVAYVPSEALSGAAIAALGCRDIVLHPQARIGDAGPIFLGEDALFRHAPEKIRSDLAARVRELATETNRPPALAEAMVDMDLVVYYARNTKSGEERFLSDREIAALDDSADWEKVKPVLESGEKRFLTVTGPRAVELKLANATVTDFAGLQRLYGWTGTPRVMRRTAVDTTVYVLNRPAITVLLFFIGLMALYAELSAPGIGFGGLVSLLCFGLFFWSRFLGGTSGWLEILLFGIGAIFLGVELFVLPGFGVAGVTGLLLMLTSVIMASQEFTIPRTTHEFEIFSNSLLVVAISGVLVVAGAVFVSRHYGSIPVLGSLVLAPPTDETFAADSPEEAKTLLAAAQAVARNQVHVGDWGRAHSPLRPAGKAAFADLLVDVVADGSFVEAGRQVRVIDVSGHRIVVREIEA